ncbi:chitin synthesis regulation, resistance to congo red-domain-containing protein [Hypoxylon fragiforme]|uniref:chitin synthesis regulation, resistance to congo red-domain-containing protein n=1 Tax=Hypoxylon fragiforme TaxID=63214 RepID=UPI0020C61A32|nr:chitin synthesis regulation, resistance to congo red-domain-containing protein [Hypoxylon fragiforme]KAI2614507.1 chitin synthesis regulation, resistance to congo red-domain-containing protein [Hypoxylon fragiforme]
MAPFMDQVGAQLTKRRYCNGDDYDRYNNCYGAWHGYGRWIFAAVVIVLIILVFALWACINSRRRRRSGLQPMYGTGWMAGKPGPNNNPSYYNNNNNNNNPPPPAYGAPPGQSYPMQNQYTGSTFSPSDGYYGQHEGVVQPPQNVYNNPNHTKGAADDYAPPEGPPPNR